MPRSKSAKTKKRRYKKIKKQAKGYIKTRRKSYRKAKEAVIKAGQRSYIGRKEKKRDFRRLWISRITAALRKYDLKYSRFINLLKKNNIDLNRKMLAELAVREPKIFETIVDSIKSKK
jgi:large subunit ribosomal protein L20